MAADPISDENAVDLGETLRVLIANWRDELIQCGKELLSSRRGPEIVLLIEQDLIVVGRAEDGVASVLGEVDLKDLPGGGFANAFARLVQEPVRDVILSIPREQVLRPQLAMPRTRRRALAQALHYEVERVSPVDPSELYFDFVPAPTGGDANTLAIELRVVRKILLDNAVSLCRTAGLAISAIEFTEDSRDADWRAFPVDKSAFLRRNIRRYGFIVLSALVAALIAIILTGVFVRNELTLGALSNAVADAGLQAAQVERLEQDIGKVSGDLGYAVREKRKPMFISTLAELTRILPDHTFVTELAMEGDKVRVQGRSSSASDLIGVIDKSPVFANAQFDAPVVHDAATNSDHFDLSFDIRGDRP